MKEVEFISPTRILKKRIEKLEKKVELAKHINEEIQLQNEIMKNLAEGIYMIRMSDGTIVYTNPNFEKMFGYKPGEMLGKHFSAVNAPTEEDPEETAKEIMEVLHKIGEWHGEVNNIKKDGTQFWCYANVSLLDHHEFGTVLISVHSDITERKKAEEERIKSLAEAATAKIAQAIFENMIDGIVLTNSQGRIIQNNKAFADLTGYGKNVIGKLPTNFVVKRDIQRAGEEMGKVFLSGYTNNFECAFLHKNKKEIPVLVSATLLRNPDGSPNGITATIKDISELKQVEKELLIRNNITNIFLTAPDDEMYHKVMEVFLKAMDSKFGIFGYIDEDGSLVIASMTRHIFDKCQVPDKNIVFPCTTWGDSTWPQAIKEKKTIFSNEPSDNIPQGHIAITRHISLPLIHKNKVIGLLQVANKETDYEETDILLFETIGGVIAPVLNAIIQRDRQKIKRRRAEEEIHKLNLDLEKRVIERTAELQTANDELEAFSYSVSHDLRAPIRAIDGFTNKISEDYSSALGEEGKRLLNIVLESTKKMGQLIDDLLSFSRLNRQKFETSLVNMEELVKEVANELEDSNKDRKLRITIRQLQQVNGDRALIRQMIVNLLTNSIKFTKPREEAIIEIGTLTKDHENIYYVKDNGVGFNMKYVDKIFDVFQRLHTTKEFEGTGVGLAIVQRIIHRHGGKIWAEAEVNKGATFNFSLSGDVSKV